jgi:hypothetical protein
MSADVDWVRRSMKRQVTTWLLLTRRPVVDRVLKLAARRDPLVDDPSDARGLEESKTGRTDSLFARRPDQFSMQ